MAWARLDDKRALNRKFRRQGFAVRGLDEAAICWCAHEETDGHVTVDALEDLAYHHGIASGEAADLAAQLVTIGRWREDDRRGGWVVKDYLDFNPSHKELEAQRKAKREAGRKGGLRGGQKRRASTNGEAPASSSGEAPASSSEEAEQKSTP